MYALCLCVSFHPMKGPTPDLTSYGCAIKACGFGGNVDACMGLMAEMLQRGMTPTMADYQSSLQACARRRRCVHFTSILVLRCGAKYGVLYCVVYTVSFDQTSYRYTLPHDSPILEAKLEVVFIHVLYRYVVLCCSHCTFLSNKLHTYMPPHDSHILRAKLEVMFMHVAYRYILLCCLYKVDKPMRTKCSYY